MIIQQLLTEPEEALFRVGGLEVKLEAHLLDQTLRGRPAFMVTVWTRAVGLDGWVPRRRLPDPVADSQLDTIYDTYGILWRADRIFKTPEGRSREDWVG